MRVAVIGTGIAGNAAAWSLSKRVNRPALCGFNEADHGMRDGSRLRLYAQRCVADGIDVTGGRVVLLCYSHFPGGMLPSPQVLKSFGERFGVLVIRERIFGQDYAKTFAIWRSNFRNAWPHLMPSGFDDRFRRLWEYYLAYCEAGFLSGNFDVRQVVFAKSG